MFKKIKKIFAIFDLIIGHYSEIRAIVIKYHELKKDGSLDYSDLEILIADFVMIFDDIFPGLNIES